MKRERKEKTERRQTGNNEEHRKGNKAGKK